MSGATGLHPGFADSVAAVFAHYLEPHVCGRAGHRAFGYRATTVSHMPPSRPPAARNDWGGGDVRNVSFSDVATDVSASART